MATISPLSADNTLQSPESQKDRESYSIGYQVGLSMNSDAVEVNFDMLVQGLRDAIGQQDPRLPEDEMKSLIVDLRKKAKEIQLQKVQEQRVRNREEADQFLAENKTKEGILTTESGLQYQVLKEGDGEMPGPEDFVTVNYIGTFTDGTEFDNSYTRGEPANFQVDGVIKGWAEALPMMKVGSRWKLYVPPELGYGRSGNGKIPPNKVLVFDIELLGVEPADASEQAAATQDTTVRNMNITGAIAKSANGYIIRGTQPQMIWTILNPNPEVLDAYVASEKIVPMTVRIVSGDNVDIQTIDGKDYS